MSGGLRICLIISSVVVLLLIIASIQRERIKVRDSIFWVLLSAVLVLIALVPGIPRFFSGLIGFQATSNFVFLATIAILFIHGFSSDLKLSRLSDKVDTLAQDIALAEQQKHE